MSQIEEAILYKIDTNDKMLQQVLEKALLFQLCKDDEQKELKKQEFLAFLEIYEFQIHKEISKLKNLEKNKDMI